MNKLKILFLAANPSDLDRLQIDTEIRAITAKVRASEWRDRIEIIPAFAARADDLLQTFNEHKPQIVHFSGHGSPDGEIVLVDAAGQAKPVSQQAIRELFRILKQECRAVVLNACYSMTQAQAIATVVDCAIGMNADLSDDGAVVFAASFYRALGFGHSVQNAFDQGRTALMLEGIAEETMPVLLVHRGVDAAGIVLVSSHTIGSQYAPPMVNKPYLYDPGALFTVSAALRDDPDTVVRVPAVRNHYVVFALDVTNGNSVNMSIDQMFVDVLAYHAVDIIDESGGLLGGVPFRRHVCLLAPQAGRYRCQALSSEYDYIRLGQGEMEKFQVNVQVEKPGVYSLKIGFHYAIGGERHTLLCQDTAYQIHFYCAEHERRIDHWRASDWPRLWVQEHRGNWNHADWEALLQDLRQSVYWPMEPAEVGAVLEDFKREWHARYRPA